MFNATSINKCKIFIRSWIAVVVRKFSGENYTFFPYFCSCPYVKNEVQNSPILQPLHIIKELSERRGMMCCLMYYQHNYKLNLNSSEIFLYKREKAGTFSWPKMWLWFCPSWLTEVCLPEAASCLWNKRRQERPKPPIAPITMAHHL